MTPGLKKYDSESEADKAKLTRTIAMIRSKVRLPRNREFF
jgi:hypothetical protein